MLNTSFKFEIISGARTCFNTIPRDGKIYKKITDNDSKSYLPYLNKLVDQCNNTYHHYTKKTPINADYSTFTEKTETNYKAPKFKVGDRVRITKYKNIFSKGYTEKLVKRNIYY